jgi:hypothetical protein
MYPNSPRGGWTAKQDGVFLFSNIKPSTDKNIITNKISITLKIFKDFFGLKNKNFRLFGRFYLTTPKKYIKTNINSVLSDPISTRIKKVKMKIICFSLFISILVVSTLSSSAVPFTDPIINPGPQQPAPPPDPQPAPLDPLTGEPIE